MGGLGYGETGFSILNDLWRYDLANSQWTWVGGDKTGSPLGVYGVQGVA